MGFRDAARESQLAPKAVTSSIWTMTTRRKSTRKARLVVRTARRTRGRASERRIVGPIKRTMADMAEMTLDQ